MFKNLGIIVFVILKIATFSIAQLDEELISDFGQGDVGLTGLSDVSDNQQQFFQQQYNFPSAVSLGGLSGVGVTNGLASGNIGIPSTESITQLGQAISEGGIPSGAHGEIATPTAQPPPHGQERRVGIAQRLYGAGFLNRR